METIPSDDSRQLPSPAAGRHRVSADNALLQVVRMVLEEGWSAEVAANRLVVLVEGDLGVLRNARARVLRGAGENPTGATERALVTLDLALCAGTHK